MIKKLLVILSVLMITLPAFAGKTVTNRPLRVGGVLVDDYSLTSGTAVTSDSVVIKANVGFTTLYLTEDQAGGAGDVDVYAEYSNDNTSWSQAYTSDMAGTITIEGNIATAFGNQSNIPIVFTPRLSRYMRIVFDPDANSEITATLIYQEEY